MRVNLEDYLKHMSCPCCSKVIYIEELFNKLVELQELVDINILTSITSGYRCREHNKNVGGVENSYHTQGKAADIYIGTLEKVLCFVGAAKKAKFKRIGYKRYKGVFVHLDVGEYPKEAEW